MDSMFNWFRKHAEADIANAVEAVDEAAKNVQALEDKLIEKWVWINGYKGTDKDMKCRGYQFEMNKCFDISDDKPVELCEHGFHLCPNFEDVFHYYGVHDNNRFFEVKALVRKSDFEKLGPIYHEDHHGYRHKIGERDKIAAKSIIFTRELTADEILKGTLAECWSTEEKKLALEIGILEANKKFTFEKLVALGYSETFAQLCMDMKRDKVALSVGSQEGLSMDMKAYLIFNINHK